MDKSRQRHSRIALLFLLLIFASTLAGCASLPAVEDMEKKLGKHERPAKAVGPHGRFSRLARKRALKKLEKQVEPTDILRRHILLVETASGAPLVAGNKATLLESGEEAHEAMLEAVRNARETINFETYIFQDDDVGREFADLLIQKAREGVRVNLIYDSFGSIGTPSSFFDRMRDAGVQVVEFNPFNPLKTLWKWRPNHRDHRKILVVDGVIAFTGGVNISNVYSKKRHLASGAGSSGSEADLPWRDTHVKIEGPAVAEFQRLFLDTWAWVDGPVDPKQKYFLRINERGDSLVMVVGSTPGQSNRITYLMYLSAIRNARSSIHLTVAYFSPVSELVKALARAAKRGVDVRIVVPQASDSPVSLRAGEYYYTRLLKAGVKLYRRKGGVLHAKTAVIDGVWSTVGSTNLDLRSFWYNDEANAVILGKEFAVSMEKLFNEDLEESDPLTLEKWKSRPKRNRLKEWGAHLISPLL